MPVTPRRSSADPSPPTEAPAAGALLLRLLLALLALAATGCSPPGRERGIPAPGVAPRVSIDEVMVAWINPASYAVWDAAREEYAPRSDADWKRLEDLALQLVASGTWITVGGTGPDDADWVADPRWIEWSVAMTDAAEAALGAARRQDLDAFLDAGNVLVESCEGCHAVFRPVPGG